MTSLFHMRPCKGRHLRLNAFSIFCHQKMSHMAVWGGLNWLSHPSLWCHGKLPTVSRKEFLHECEWIKIKTWSRMWWDFFSFFGIAIQENNGSSFDLLSSLSLEKTDQPLLSLSSSSDSQRKFHPSKFGFTFVAVSHILLEIIN